MLPQIREALTDAHVILGDLGRDKAGRWALLVVESAHQRLRVALIESSAASGTFEMTLLDSLDASIPANDIPCPFCDKTLRVWGRHCTRCGKDLSGPRADALDMSSAELARQIQESADNAYQFLGWISHLDGGGAVYFGREVVSRRLVALPIEASSGTSEQRSRIGFSGRHQAIDAIAMPIRGPDVSPAADVAPAETGDLLAELRTQSRDEYEIFGEMGRVGASVFFLARELVSSDLVVLRLSPATGGYVLDVDRRVDPVSLGRHAICAGCGARLDDAVDRCVRCGRLVSSRGRSETERRDERERLLEMTEAAGHEFSFVGEVDRSNPARTTYLAIRVADDAVVGVVRERSRSFGRENAFVIREMPALALLDERRANVEPPTPEPGPPQPERVIQHEPVHAEERSDISRRKMPPVVVTPAEERRWLVPSILAVLVVLALVVAVANALV